MKKNKIPNPREIRLPNASDGLSVQQAGRRGGRATLSKHGTDFFRRIGKKGGQRTAERYSYLLKEFGKKGGRPRRPALAEHMGEETGTERGVIWRSAPGFFPHHILAQSEGDSGQAQIGPGNNLKVEL